MTAGNHHATDFVGKQNVDRATVDGFGVEWRRFDQTELPPEEFAAIFEQYFAIFDFTRLRVDAEGFDAGCGSGRWARGVAPRVGILHCVDASEAALDVAKRALSSFPNCRFHPASLDDMPFADGTMDFGYSLGVLHHLPDPLQGLKSCTSKLKRGAPFLAYVYYAFDNKPLWYRGLWRVSDFCRRTLSHSPARLRVAAADALALGVYWPLARAARLLARLGYDVSAFPLAFYRDRSFYTMRTDALDRFGTRVEHRFSRQQITEMMTLAGLVDLQFSESAPYWCVVGKRA
jgi:SAM-dependent methyltransferase